MLFYPHHLNVWFWDSTLSDNYKMNTTLRTDAKTEDWERAGQQGHTPPDIVQGEEIDPELIISRVQLN